MKRTVLIVEDDPSFAEFLDVTVRAAGYDTVVAHDGEKAMELFEASRPDLVFLDMLVPRKDGQALCRQMRTHAEYGGVPILVLTGIYKKKEYREAMRENFGVTDYLTKPVRITDLWDALQRHLGAGEGRQQTVSVSPSEGEDLFSGRPVSRDPLAAQLRDLMDSQRTGLLFLKDGGRVVILYVEMGQIVFARSNDPETRLSRLLVSRGLLSEEDAAKAEELLASGAEGLRMGEILVSLNLLGRERLEEVVQEHLEELVMNAFRCDQWNTHFVEGDLPNEEAIRIRPTTNQLILQGVRAMEGLEKIRGHLPPLNSVPARTRDAAKKVVDLGLTPYEEKMLGLCDGTRSVRKILSIGRLAPVEIERLLFAFLHTGLIRIVGEVGEPQARNTTLAGAMDVAPGGGEERSGTLSEALLPRVLADLSRERATGVLRVGRDSAEAWLYLDRGALVFAGSNEASSRIGEILIETRLVSEEEVREAAEKIQDQGEGPRLGQTLVEAGIINLEELSWAMTLQMQHRMQDLLLWTRGEWHFKPGPLPTDEPITLEFSTTDVLLEGIRRMDPDSLDTHLPQGPHQLKAARGARTLEGQMSLTVQEKKLLERVRGGLSMDRVLSGGEFPADFARRTVYAFLTMGLVEAEKEQSLEEEAESALGFLDEPAPAAARAAATARAAKAKTPPAARSPEMVPRALLDQSQAKQQEMRREMYELYRRFDFMKGVVAALRDELLTLKTSPLYSRLEPDMQATVGGLVDEYLDRLVEESEDDSVGGWGLAARG